MIPLETSDGFGGFRIFGVIDYAGVGLLWAAFGATLLVTERPAHPAEVRRITEERRVMGLRPSAAIDLSRRRSELPQAAPTPRGNSCGFRGLADTDPISDRAFLSGLLHHA